MGFSAVFLLILVVIAAVFILPIISLIIAIQAKDEARKLRNRLDRLHPTSPQHRPQPTSIRPSPSHHSQIAPPPTPKSPLSPETSQAMSSLQHAPEPLTSQKTHTTPPATPSGQTSTRVQKPKGSLEEKLGSWLPLWIGAIAMAIGGIWLAKYVLEQNMLGPEARVGLGSLLGLAMLAAGTWLHTRQRYIAAALIAVGVADLYGWIFAATSLYHMMPMWLGFTLMVVVTALAVGLSLRHGSIVAIVGMVGAFLTPILVSRDALTVNVFVYLFLLQVGLVYITRLKGWWILALLTLVGSILWATIWVFGILLGYMDSQDGAWIGLFLVLTAAAIVLLADTNDAAYWPRPKLGIWLSWLAVLPAMVLISLTISANIYDPPTWVLMGVLSAGLIGLGRLRPAYAAMPWLAAAVTLFVASVSVFQLHPSAITDEAIAEQTMMQWVWLGFASLFVFGAYRCAWGSRKPSDWLSLCVVAAIGWFAIGWISPMQLPESLQWWMLGLAGCAMLALAAASIYRSPEMMRAENVFAWPILGIIALLAISAADLVEVRWLGLAWAIELPLVVLMCARLRVQWLREIVLILTVGIVLVLLLHPANLRLPVEMTPAIYQLLAGFGIPALSLAMTAWIMNRQQRLDHAMNAIVEGACIIISFCMFSLFVRNIFHMDVSWTHAFLWKEMVILVNVWLALGLACLLIYHVHTQNILAHAGCALVLLSVLTILLSLVGDQNPLFKPIEVGSWPILNWLSLAYAVPMVLFVLIGRAIRRYWPDIATACHAMPVLLLLVWVTLQIRQWFHGTYIDASPLMTAENYSYSVAWIVLGLLLLVAGIVRQSKAERIASLVVMALAVCKVFLFDVRHLSDLYRILSFLGLGLSLLMLAYLYQRFVFHRSSNLPQENKP